MTASKSGTYNTELHKVFAVLRLVALTLQNRYSFMPMSMLIDNNLQVRSLLLPPFVGINTVNKHAEPWQRTARWIVPQRSTTQASCRHGRHYPPTMHCYCSSKPVPEMWICARPAPKGRGPLSHGHIGSVMAQPFLWVEESWSDFHYKSPVHGIAI